MCPDHESSCAQLDEQTNATENKTLVEVTTLFEHTKNTLKKQYF